MCKDLMNEKGGTAQLYAHAAVGVDHLLKNKPSLEGAAACRGKEADVIALVGIKGGEKSPLSVQQTAESLCARLAEDFDSLYARLKPWEEEEDPLFFPLQPVLADLLGTQDTLPVSMLQIFALAPDGRSLMAYTGMGTTAMLCAQENQGYYCEDAGEFALRRSLPQDCHTVLLLGEGCFDALRNVEESRSGAEVLLLAQIAVNHAPGDGLPKFLESHYRCATPRDVSAAVLCMDSEALAEKNVSFIFPLPTVPGYDLAMDYGDVFDRLPGEISCFYMLECDIEMEDCGFRTLRNLVAPPMTQERLQAALCEKRRACELSTDACEELAIVCAPYDVHLTFDDSSLPLHAAVPAAFSAPSPEGWEYCPLDAEHRRAANYGSGVLLPRLYETVRAQGTEEQLRQCERADEIMCEYPIGCRIYTSAKSMWLKLRGIYGITGEDAVRLMGLSIDSPEGWGLRWAYEHEKFYADCPYDLEAFMPYSLK